MGKLGNGLESLFKLFKKKDLHNLRVLLNKVVGEIWNYASDTDVNGAVVKFEYVTGDIELTD